MNRRSFLQRAAGAAALIAAGRVYAPPVAPAELAPAAEPFVDYQIGDAIPVMATSALRASNGICAPIAPFYDLHVIRAGDPLVAILPSFRADLGGITYRRP